MDVSSSKPLCDAAHAILKGEYAAWLTKSLMLKGLTTPSASVRNLNTNRPRTAHALLMPLCRLLVTGGWCTSVVVAGCGVCFVCWMLGGWITKRHDLWVPSQYHVVKDRLDTACQYADW